MASRRQSKVECSMFPFLSVLCTLIGVLMLFMLLVVTTRAVDIQESRAEAVPPPPAPPPPPPKRHDPESTGVSEETFQRLEQRVKELAATFAQRAAERDALLAKVAELEDVLASKEDEVLERQTGSGKLPGIRLEKPDDVEFVPVKGSSLVKRARFIEVRASELVIQPEGKTHAASEVDQAGSPLRQFLKRMDARREKEYLLFLIHPNGVPLFQRLDAMLRKEFPGKDPQKSRIDMGYEPFSEGWLLISKQMQGEP
jgi:hypothetical protein